MNNIKIRQIPLLVVLQIFIIISDVKPFGPITHFYINKETQDLGCLFNTYGMMPDAIIVLENWVNPAHSPNPVEENRKYPYVSTPNFAFILNKISRNSNEENISLGWGGHISADWIAHNPKFLPIVPLSNILGTLRHFGIETAIDLYMFISRGRISPTYRIYGHHIWKGFVNWQLIQKHDKNGEFPTTSTVDKKDRDKAIKEVNSEIPTFKITFALIWWSGIIAVQQMGFDNLIKSVSLHL